MSKTLSPSVPVRLEALKDLTRLVQTTEGFHPLIAALKNGHGGTVEGAWGSAGALATAAVGLHAPSTLLIVLAFPRDIDGWIGDLTSFAGLPPVVIPAWDHMPEDAGAFDEVAGQRLRILKDLSAGRVPRLLLTTIHALIQPVPDRAQLERGRRTLQVGTQVDLDELSGWLVDNGFQRNEAVELPGDFSRRGGILDVFSPDAADPYRVEFFGDDIESIRRFSLQTQRSVEDMASAEFMAVNLERRDNIKSALRPGEKKRVAAVGSDGVAIFPRGDVTEYLPADAWTLLVEPDDLREQGRQLFDRTADQRGLFSVEAACQHALRFPNLRLTALPSPGVETSWQLRTETVERFSGNVTKLRDELDGVAAQDQVLIACHNEAESKRLHEVLAAGQLAQSDRLRLVLGQVRAGFRLIPGARDQRSEVRSQRSEVRPPTVLTSDLRPPTSDVSSLTPILILGDHELFHREDARPLAPRRRIESRAIDSFLDLADGDLVVHVSHGIARFRGMQVLDNKGHTEEHLVLEFREGVRLYVPASKIDLVQKYVGGAKADPELSKLGGTSWQRKKDRVEAAVIDLASDMVELQAIRDSQAGVPYPPDTEWQSEFEAAFPYKETPDQLTTLTEIKRDLQRPRPMDRLICGDVGYGKTELAIRAAFKVIDNGKQVAVLVPTTILAEQHFRTFTERLAEYPFVVECISRFRSHAEQKRIVERLAGGGVDIIIGTHRLLSADVKFQDLGLVIIDEEQRFGVEHKERLKKLRQMVDVLTMTATPIPRTLHLSLLGIRDISNLETPPADRLAIETRIARFDPELIRHAVLRELNRDGQVFFVHNRVYNIKEIAAKVQAIVPEARIEIGHGQMAEHELEQAMLKFVSREADILVATTIIESGLDIPNANTIFINQADNYGLADLHQLRGRVGRYKHRAYAYMLLDSEGSVTPTATRRLKAIEEFTELGAGFKIALRDLEIRGAGNILGTQQSGHIAAVGYELYCQLLENSVRRLKNIPVRVPLEVTVDLPWPAYLPRDYVPGQRLRIEVYRRLARIRRRERLDDFRSELRDRFGSPPDVTEWLLRIAELRLLATRWQIGSIHLEKQSELDIGPTDVVLKYRSPRLIQRLANRSAGRLRVVDSQSAYLRLHANKTEPAVLYSMLKDLLRFPERRL